MLSGSGTDELYVPSLWYYKELEFLQDQVEEESGISSITGQTESSSKLPTSTSTQSPLPPSASISPVQIKKKKKEDLQHDLMTLARDHYKKPENEYQVMARNWAFKLERMSGEQRRLAEKFINEILFEGEEGNLHRHSVVINPSQPALAWNTPSPIPYTPSPISHTSSEQSYLSNTEQPVMIHISDSQTNENNPTEPEDDTAAKFINNFYSL
ncbi:unnamed protein product [Leptidea sinapis]|uniref:Uncharacterized protein n=1 Tax=Leptidea sinapis TaxID=189913 RepID=A0A5E4QMT6_9NEOP|nr:unnamed protein product [Leptidea sinapis]